MRKNKLLLLLALLLTAATGAWAQTETLLTTIVNTGDNASFKSGSKTFDDKVTVTFSSSVFNEGNSFGWYSMDLSLLTVAGTNGYTITSCKFYTQSGTANTGYTVEGESPSVYLYNGYVYTDANQSVNIGSFGITKIEVYGAVAAPSGYTVSMKDGVKDADKWTVKVGEGQAQALPIGGLNEGDAVTLQYNGRLKVKGVKATSDAAPAGNSVDLSTLTADYEAQNGDVLTGTLNGAQKITIADGATVTLDGVTIEGVNSDWYPFAALTCVGDATIILKEGSTNKLKGFQSGYPGIFVPEGKTLTIQGSGSLDASAEGAAGIGGGYAKHCGNITIEGGTITATGAYGAAGIGGGWKGNCGNITIKKTVTSVTATKGYGANSIGAGKEGSCGTVTIEEGANVTQN